MMLPPSALPTFPSSNRSVYWCAGGNIHALDSAEKRIVGLRRIQQQEKEILMHHHATLF
jgi:hypothetical protein